MQAERLLNHLIRQDRSNAVQSSKLGSVCCFRVAALYLEDSNMLPDDLSQYIKDKHRLHELLLIHLRYCEVKSEIADWPL
jgi:hypothetical protein